MDRCWCCVGRYHLRYSDGSDDTEVPFADVRAPKTKESGTVGLVGDDGGEGSAAGAVTNLERHWNQSADHFSAAGAKDAEQLAASVRQANYCTHPRTV